MMRGTRIKGHPAVSNQLENHILSPPRTKYRRITMGPPQFPIERMTQFRTSRAFLMLLLSWASISTVRLVALPPSPLSPLPSPTPPSPLKSQCQEEFGFFEAVHDDEIRVNYSDNIGSFPTSIILRFDCHELK